MGLFRKSSDNTDKDSNSNLKVSVTTSSYTAYEQLKKGYRFTPLPFGTIYSEEPTEKQLAYAADLGITLPEGVGKADVSAILSRVEDGEPDISSEKFLGPKERQYEIIPLPGPDVDFAAFAQQSGLEFSRYIGGSDLLDEVVCSLNNEEKAAFYAYCVVCQETNSPIKNMLEHPRLNDFYTYAKLVVKDESLLASLNRIRPYEYLKPHRGTKAYKAAAEILLAPSTASAPVASSEKPVANNWFENITNTDQLKRLERAKQAECTPLSVDREKETGSFSGKYGIYETSMKHCTCQDYTRRRLPCKHMMRLAIELGYIEEAAESGIGKVYAPVSGLSLAETVQRLESLTEAAQRLYQDFLLEHSYRKKENVSFENSLELISLIEAGLLKTVRNDRSFLEALTEEKIMEHLQIAGVAPKKHPRTNADLINWCLENVEDILDMFSDCSVVTAPEDTKKSMRKTYSYLHRKFDDDYYMDEDGKTVEYPAGASFTATVCIDGTVSSCWVFPQDEVTALLNQYHCNRCSNMSSTAKPPQDTAPNISGFQNSCTEAPPKTNDLNLEEASPKSCYVTTWLWAIGLHRLYLGKIITGLLYPLVMFLLLVFMIGGPTQIVRGFCIGIFNAVLWLECSKIFKGAFKDKQGRPVINWYERPGRKDEKRTASKLLTWVVKGLVLFVSFLAI